MSRFGAWCALVIFAFCGLCGCRTTTSENEDAAKLKTMNDVKHAKMALDEFFDAIYAAKPEDAKRLTRPSHARSTGESVNNTGESLDDLVAYMCALQRVRIEWHKRFGTAPPETTYTPPKTFFGAQDLAKVKDLISSADADIQGNLCTLTMSKAAIEKTDEGYWIGNGIFRLVNDGGWKLDLQDLLLEPGLKEHGSPEDLRLAHESLRLLANITRHLNNVSDGISSGRLQTEIDAERMLGK
jgi:hypothetical protein